MNDLQQKYKKMLEQANNPERLKALEEQNKQEQQRAVEVTKEKIISRFGERFMRANFKSYQIYDPAQERVINKCKSLNLETDSLILSGIPGTGKTHIITALFRNFTKSIELTTFEEIAEEKIAAQNNGKVWQNVLKKYTTCQALVIDDFGLRGSLTDSQRDVLYHIFDERYKKLKPIVITTNLTPKQFINIIDLEHKRNYRRLYEMTANFDNLLVLSWNPFYKQAKKDVVRLEEGL